MVTRVTWHSTPSPAEGGPGPVTPGFRTFFTGIVRSHSRIHHWSGQRMGTRSKTNCSYSSRGATSLTVSGQDFHLVREKPASVISDGSLRSMPLTPPPPPQKPSSFLVKVLMWKLYLLFKPQRVRCCPETSGHPCPEPRSAAAQNGWWLASPEFRRERQYPRPLGSTVWSLKTVHWARTLVISRTIS